MEYHQTAEFRSIPQVPFSLVFSIFRDGKKFNAARKSNDKQAKAIHVEVAWENALGARLMFSDLYRSNATTSPLHIWLRYVDTPLPSLTRQMRDGATTLRNKQVWVPDSIEHGQTWDILDLDIKIKNHDFSLCTMMMEIWSREDKNLLFMSINKDKYGNGHFVTFQKRKELEARDMIVQFGSFLIHTYSVKIVTSLTVAAATRAKSAPWGVATHSAKSPEDESLQQLVTLADGMNWLKNPQAAAPVILKPPDQQKFAQKNNVTFQFNPDTSSIAKFNPDKLKDVDSDAPEDRADGKDGDMEISSDSSTLEHTNQDDANDNNEMENSVVMQREVNMVSPMHENVRARRKEDGETRKTPSSIPPSPLPGTGGGKPRPTAQSVPQNVTPTTGTPTRKRSSGLDIPSRQITRNYSKEEDQSTPNIDCLKPNGNVVACLNNNKNKNNNITVMNQLIL